MTNMNAEKEIVPRGAMTWLRTYQEVQEVLLSPNFAAALHNRHSYPIVGESLLTLVGEEHRRRRRKEIVMFSRRSLIEYELALVVPAVRESLDAAIATDGHEVDLMDVTNNALLRVSARIVGLDGVDSPEDVARLKEVAGRLGEGASIEWAMEDADAIMVRAVSAKEEFHDLFWADSRARRERLVQAWRAGTLPDSQLPEDLLTILLKEYDVWDEDKLLRECIFFLVASGSTTTHSAPHTLQELSRWLSQNPDQQAVTSDFSFLRQAVSEALRLHPPVPALLRTALQDVSLSTGRTVRSGESLALDLVSANRDPAVYGDNAHTFDPMRDARPRVHPYGMSFGAGPHTCPGRLVAVGGGGSKTDRDDVNVGVLVRLVRELYRRGVRMNPSNPPVKRSDTEADRFATFPVLVGRS